MSLNECELWKKHFVLILIWIYYVGVIKTDNYFTSNSENFESVPTTVKTYENDTVLLPCYSVVPYQYVRWLRDDVSIADSRYPDHPMPPRITLFNNGSLQVRDVQRNDTAEYLCEVMTTAFALETQLHAIEVQYPPSVISNPSGRIEVKLGSIFEIVCEERGIPHPIISWRINGEMNGTQLENNRRKLVEVRDRSVAGRIECIATNGVGQPAVAGVDMIVQFSPEIKATANVVHTKLMVNTQLECTVIAQPKANVHWFHHGLPVSTTNNNRISRQDHGILTNSTVNEYHSDTKHILFIRNVKETDFGMYDCRAENQLGINGASIDLTGRPGVPIFKKSPMASDHMTHYLIWQTESLSPIIEHKLKFRKIPSGNITPMNRKYASSWHEIIVPADTSEGPIHSTGYNLKGLEPASVYEVSVVSRNRFGWSDSSRIIRFATIGEILLVELPNYSSTESGDEQYYEQSYYDDSSSSAMDPQSTLDTMDPYNPYLFDPYHGKATRNTEKCLLLLTLVTLLRFY